MTAEPYEIISLAQDKTFTQVTEYALCHKYPVSLRRNITEIPRLEHADKYQLNTNGYET